MLLTGRPPWVSKPPMDGMTCAPSHHNPSGTSKRGQERVWLRPEHKMKVSYGRGGTFRGYWEVLVKGKAWAKVLRIWKQHVVTRGPREDKSDQKPR